MLKKNYKNIQNFAPILVLAYNRPDHLGNTLASLSLNKYSEKSDLFLSIDGPRKTEDRYLINQCIKTANKFKKKFKSFDIQIKDKNIGLAKNITSSIDKYISLKKKLIILEDDIVCSPLFLTYMNYFLNYFDNTNVWHISGYVPEIYSNRLHPFFLTRMMQCWGWATWQNKWEYFKKDPEYFENIFTNRDVYDFNLEDTFKQLWQQMIQNKNGEIDTWAIFWYATIFKNNGLCLSPNTSYVHNIGLDNSGEHCEYEHTFKLPKLNTNENFLFCQSITKENKYAFNLLKKYYKSRNNIINRICRKIINKIFFYFEK